MQVLHESVGTCCSRKSWTMVVAERLADISRHSLFGLSLRIQKRTNICPFSDTILIQQAAHYSGPSPQSSATALQPLQEWGWDCGWKEKWVGGDPPTPILHSTIGHRHLHRFHRSLLPSPTTFASSTTAWRLFMMPRCHIHLLDANIPLSQIDTKPKVRLPPTVGYTAQYNHCDRCA